VRYESINKNAKSEELKKTLRTTLCGDTARPNLAPFASPFLAMVSTCNFFFQFVHAVY